MRCNRRVVQDSNVEVGARSPLLLIALSVIWRAKGGLDSETQSLLTVTRELVEQEVRSAMQALIGIFSTAKPAKNERRRRRRRRGPGRPPGSTNKKASGLTARPTNPGRSWR